MNGNELLDKMALIAPEYIEAADTASANRKDKWLRWVAAAACFCLSAMAAWTLHAGTNLFVSPDPTVPAAQESPTEIHLDIGTAPSAPSASNGAIGQDFLGGKPMVSGYGAGRLPVDMAVTNGGICYSTSLQSAMDHYGEAANYRVLIELFSDGVQIPGNSSSAVAEAQRLSDLGYITAMEAYTETEVHGALTTATATYYFTLHATYEQLANFCASSDLGYFIMLYDESGGDCPKDHTESYNIPQSTTPQDKKPIAPFDELFTEPPCYNPEASDG